MSTSVFSQILSAPFSAIGGIARPQAHGAPLINKNQVAPLVAGCVVLAALFLSSAEIVIGLLGAVLYAVLQSSQAASRVKPKKASKLAVEHPSSPASPALQRQQQQRCGSGPRASQGSASAAERSRTREQAPPKRSASLSQQKPEYKQESVKPVAPTTFQAVCYEGEVRELLQQVTPTLENDQVVQRVVKFVEKVLLPIIPEAEVSGFASGSIKGNKAFGVAVPEVDIVVSASPEVLVQRLRSLLPNGAYLSKLDAKKLTKSAIRACTDQLVSKGGFKFRRSAFRCDEPKFTLLVPSSLGLSDDAIAIDFTVNSPTPLFYAALFTECGQIDPRAKDLILLVRRWARDRGISHAARGHLPPYAWTLLVIYFLQVGLECEGEENGILPAFTSFASSAIAGQAGEAASSAVRSRSSACTSEKPVGLLFQEFIRFYYRRFNYRTEAASIRLGKRAAPNLNLPLHIVLASHDSTSHVAPSIQDPFMPNKNIATCMTAEGLERFHEEMARAYGILCQQEGGSLATLLQLWAPPTLGTASSPAKEELSDQ